MGTRGCLKGALLSAVVIASLILSVSHVARAQFEVSSDERWEAWIRAPLPRSVEVSISPGSRSGLPGTSFSYTVTVKNTGSIADTYTLSAVGAEGWSVSIEPTSLTLDAGASGTATLNVVVPPDAEEGTVMTTTVSAKSEGDPTVIETDTCGTIVTFLGPPPPLTSLTISEENFTLQTGKSKYLTATLTYGHNVIKGETITWSATAGTIAPLSSETNTAGQVSVVYTAPSYETYVIVSASYAGGDQYESSSVNSFGTITAPTTGISMELAIAIAIVIGCAIIGAAILLAKRR